MDISGISTSLDTRMLTSTTARGELQPLAKNESAAELRRDDLRGLRGRRGLALGILKQELRSALRSFLNSQLAAAYSKDAGTDSPENVANEVLGVAKQVIAEAPTAGSDSLVALRSTVDEAAGSARIAVGLDNGGIDDVDEATAIIGNGLDDLSSEVANYRESSASILAVDTSTRERSTIQIRTQEGDFVKLYLRRVENMSATDIAYANNETSFAGTEVAVSGSSRTLLQVKGDLNESELTAIRNVFAQAETIADEFFAGDIGAAFNSMQSSEFDTEQLARVDLRFRFRQITTTTYARADMTEAADMAVAPPPGESVPVAAETAIATNSEGMPAVEQAVAGLPDTVETDQPVADDADTNPNLYTPIADFLETLSAFLRTVGEGFKAETSSANYTYHYSEAFKLNLLKAVINTAAPEDAGNGAANAELVIDGVNADT